MKSLPLAALGFLLAAHAARANCQGIVTEQNEIYVAGRTQLQWCWDDVTGGSGALVYVVESSTNGAAWVPEGETTLPEWSLVRNIGDTVTLRYYACDDLECSAYSPESQPVSLYPDFDANGDGVVGSPDFEAVKYSLDSTTFSWFRKIFGSAVVAGVYLN